MTISTIETLAVDDATAFVEQVANDPDLSPNARAVAVIMASTIRGYRPVAAINWRTVWKSSGLLRGESRDALDELIHGGHIGQPQGGWDQTPGFPIRLHGGVPAGPSHQ